MTTIKIPGSTYTYKSSTSKKIFTTGTIIKLVIYLIIFLFAIFLSFKCNKGFTLGGFLGACCCSPFYIIYKLATSWKVCFSG